MNYQKQPVQINFQKGLDTKTDPWQLPADSFLGLENMVFSTGGRLTKRYGYAGINTTVTLTSGNVTTKTMGLAGATFLTTLNNNLTAVGQNLLAYSADTQTWINKGALQPVELSVLPLIRSNTNQSQVDTAISSSGLICTVYTDQTPTSLSTLRYLYSISDSVTGQFVVNPTLIPVSTGTVTGSPRVFVLGGYFVIVFTNVISGQSHLQYVAISTGTPTTVSTNVDIAANYTSAPTLSWDGVVVNSNLFIAYNTTAGGQSIKVTSLSSSLSLATPITFTNSGHVTATMMSVCADITNSASPVIWVSYYNSATSLGYAFAVNQNLFQVLAPTQIIASGTILNLTSQATGGVLTFYYEVSNTYSYDTGLATNYINQNTLTQTGTLGTASVLARSVGLASKAFTVNGAYYVLSVYSSQYQPTYFLLNASGQVVSKFAYENAGGYYTVGLPSVTVNGNVAQVGYLFKDFLESENSFGSTGSTTTTNIYSQTGINLINLTLGTDSVVSAETASALHLTGGFLWMYDGVSPVEHNFFLYPDNVEGTPANSGGSMLAQQYQYQVCYVWSDNKGLIHRSAPSIPTIVDMSTNNKAFTQPTALTPTGTGTSGQSTIIVSSATGLALGQIITDTTNPSYIQSGTYITNIVGTTIYLSLPLAGSPSADTLSISSICSVTLNIPYLRLTYKMSNPVKIEIYRWSTAQEEFFQVTTIKTPVINSTTSDSVAFVDTFSDNQISGNSLLYTTGNVVENIGAPSFNAVTLFDDRLWGIDAEDPNLLWFSKQVIESTPVELSDLFTIYVAPSIGSQGSTGNLQCIFPLDDKLILFKENALYYINGSGPDNTGANSTYSQPTFITSVVGSTNQQSIVFMPDGLMFQSDKGIWLLGRDLSVKYIGAEVEAYAIGNSVTSAAAIPETTQVRFTLNAQDEPGITLMYDYYYKQWGTFTGVPAISSTLYNGWHTYLNSYGAVYQETPGNYLDGSNPVLLGFTTAWIALTGLSGYQRAYFFYLIGQYLTPHFLQISVAYDYNPSPQQSLVLQPSNFSPYYGGSGADSATPYGQQTPYGGPSSLENWRGFFVKQRCQSFQMTIQEVYDPSFGITAGAGLTISGLKLIVAAARSFRSQGNANTISNQSGSQ